MTTPMRRTGWLLLLVALLTTASGCELRREAAAHRGVVASRVAAPARPAVAAAPPVRWPSVRWRRSTAVGSPSAGSLRAGVQLPAEGRDHFTWDPVLRRSPDRAWRRWGTDRLVRIVIEVLREHRRAYGQSARVGVGDLSRPSGGDFGARFGHIGHVSHQNGLDVDIYYPRRDGREEAPVRVDQVARARAQDLVDRFVAAGAELVFVGPATGLTGPPGVVQALPHHDNHLHVRVRP